MSLSRSVDVATDYTKTYHPHSLFPLTNSLKAPSCDSQFFPVTKMPSSLQPPLDTENAVWKMDKTKFGYRMLQKMGWEEGKGLGVKEDGVIEHIRVRRKHSSGGVGAAGTSAAWEVPSKVAAGLNDVLAALKSVETRPLESGGREKVETRRGFYERRRAGKCVANYSKEDLREIFGGAECAVGESFVGDMREEKASSDNEDTRQERDEGLEYDQEHREHGGHVQDEQEKKDMGLEDRRQQQKKERKERKELKGKKLKKLKVKSDISKKGKNGKGTKKTKSKR